MADMATALLISGSIAFLLAVNAFRSPRWGPILIFGFFAGWLTSELAVHAAALAGALAAYFVWHGALAHTTGIVGLALTVAAIAGLWAHHRIARKTADLVDAALSNALGEAASATSDKARSELDQALAVAPPRFRLLNPFLLFDRRVERTSNVSYGPHGFRNLLDIYRPKHPTGSPAPVLLYVHGGGWVVSQKRHQGRPIVNDFSSRGWVCVSINYRLSPRATFPDHLIDVKRAIAWIREHIAEYGGDPSFVAICGGSAGAHLSALAALTPNDPQYQPGFEAADTTLQAALPQYGIYDWTGAIPHWDEQGCRWFIEQWIVKQKLAEAPEAFHAGSPLSQVGPHAPPFLLTHGTNDSLAPVRHGRIFSEALRKASQQPVCYIELPFAQHAFEVFHSTRSRHVMRGVFQFAMVAWLRHNEQASELELTVRPDPAELAAA
jgi:acetyl esterase/lipase